MNSAEKIKAVVRQKYSEIALQDRDSNANSCCGVGTPGTYTIMSDNYSDLQGYNPDADLGLGCGLPTEFAKIKEGDTVLDLGSGAGNDCFVARAEAGATGKVIGVDFTPKMLHLARQNADQLGYNNVEFRHGDIDDLPITDNSVDVTVSNCVLNLVPDKAQVFKEIFRTLRPGGHFSISDVVLEGELPQKLKEAAEMYAGCVAGAMQMDEYLEIIRQTGFENMTVQKQKPILVPDEILLEYLSKEELDAFVASKTGIFSITVFAAKPGGSNVPKSTAKPKINLSDLIQDNGCKPGSGCC